LGGKSPFDIVREKNQLRSIAILFEILIKYQNDHSFNHFVDG